MTSTTEEPTVEEGQEIRDLQGTPAEPEGLTIPEAATALGLSQDTIRRRIKEGKLSAVLDGQGRYRITLPTPDPQPETASHTADSTAVEVAVLRAQLASLQRERDTLAEELAARRQEAADAATERTQLRLLLGHAQGMSTLHDPRTYDESEAGAPKPRRRWWQSR